MGTPTPAMARPTPYLFAFALAFVLLASSLAQDTPTTVAEAMTRISEVMKAKLPLCQNQTGGEAAIMTQLEAISEVIKTQENLLVDLRYMSNKLAEEIEAY